MTEDVHFETPKPADLKDILEFPMRRGLFSLKARINGTLFSLSDDSVRAAAAGLLIHDAELLNWIAGPYCVICGAALLHTDHTEWSTQETRNATIPDTCGRCCTPQPNAGICSREIRRGVYSSLMRQVHIWLKSPTST